MKHLFKEGDEVAHIGNLECKLYVHEIKKKKIKMESGKMLDKILGIQVYWFEESKRINEVYHSRLLVPFSIALQGQEEVDKFINNNSILIR